MIKVKEIEIRGIRGIKDPLMLNLDNKSILIFGENGSGKSSVTDAIEWYYSDGIEHLSGREAGAAKGRASLRNLFIPDKEEAFARIAYSDKLLDTKKTINSLLKATTSNDTDDFKKYLVDTQSENLILRYRDLLKFIISTPGERLETLQGIIGFSEVAEIRSLLKKSVGRIERTIKNAKYDDQKNFQQSTVLENLGQNAYSDDQFFAGAENLIKPLQMKKNIKSYQDIQDLLKLIEAEEDTALLEQINSYRRIEEKNTEILGTIDNIHISYSNYHALFMELYKDPESIQKLQLLDLLKQGQDVLKNDIVQGDYCPLCQQEKSKIELLRELNERIKALEDLEQKRNKLEAERQSIKSILRADLNIIDGLLREKIFEDMDQAGLLNDVQQVRNSIFDFSKEIEKELFSKDPIPEPGKISMDKDGISKIVEKAQDEVERLTQSKGTNIKLQTYNKLANSVKAYKEFQKVRTQQEILVQQQATFRVLYDEFIKRQEAALGMFLEMYSTNLDSYYATMNPGEKMENIKLISNKDKNDDLVGVTIEFSFFNETKTAPTAYLSESHINCLGLSFFLASVKAFNKRNKFFLLDDVISSFDRPHRARFVRLLTEQFEDYQILLLTHERGFFELFASDVKNKGWGILDFKWSKDFGVEVEKTAIDIRERILKKLESKEMDGLGNDIRIYTEKGMKQVAKNIEAQVAFRYNEMNEKRMASELLDAVHGRISKKGNELTEKANIPKLKGMPMFLENVTSHDNEFAESIEDLAAIWEEVEKIFNVFYCEECKKYISMEYFDNVENKIRCKCGKLTYDWKK